MIKKTTELTKFNTAFSEDAFPRDLVSYMSSFLDYQSLMFFRMSCIFFERSSRYEFIKQKIGSVTQVISYPVFYSIDTIHRHTLYVRKNGKVWAYGDNNPTNLSEEEYTLKPKMLTCVCDNTQKVVIGDGYTLFIQKDGTVVVHGRNQSELGLSDKYKGQDLLDNVTIPSLTDVQDIVIVNNRLIILNRNGTPLSYENNNKIFFNLTETVQAIYSDPARKNSSAFLLTNGGNVYCLSGSSLETTAMTNLEDIQAIAATTNFTLFLNKDGSVLFCGHDDLNLFDGDIVECDKLVKIPKISGVQAIAAGYGIGLFLKKNGTVYSCGWNRFGQLGLGDTKNRSTPTQIPITGIQDIFVGYNSSFFSKKDGTIWGCGDNQKGQLLLQPSSQTPKKITKPAPIPIPLPPHKKLLSLIESRQTLKASGFSESSVIQESLTESMKKCQIL
jgi:alpha-tubulin suppressor-like RCC1 family protein